MLKTSCPICDEPYCVGDELRGCGAQCQLCGAMLELPVEDGAATVINLPPSTEVCCPACKAVLEVYSYMRGSSGTCGQCGIEFRIPEAMPESSHGTVSVPAPAFEVRRPSLDPEADERELWSNTDTMRLSLGTDGTDSLAGDSLRPATLPPGASTIRLPQK